VLCGGREWDRKRFDAAGFDRSGPKTGGWS
jgi:hypothetical protein